ncbi:MAG: PadR family transcriptional regulator [Methanobacterium sp.]|jgi:PadR family transcriptional regulator PadR
MGLIFFHEKIRKILYVDINIRYLNSISKLNIENRYQNSRGTEFMLNRKFFLGFIRIHILYRASKKEIYGVQMIDELKKLGYQVSPGTIYPILHSLEKEGFLKSRKKNVRGKIRKYYKITVNGEKILQESRKKIKKLIKEVIIQ